MSEQVHLPQGDWPVSFEAVRIHQHLAFRALHPREKIRAMEDMAEFVEAVRKSRETRERDATGIP
jgi:hypothetical protein